MYLKIFHSKRVNDFQRGKSITSFTVQEVDVDVIGMRSVLCVWW